MKHLFTLNKYIQKYWLKFLLGIIFIIAANVFGVFPPIIFRYSFDIVKEDIQFYLLLADFNIASTFYTTFKVSLLVFALLIISMAFFRGVFMFFMRQTIIVMSRLIEYNLRNALYNKYQALELSFYKQQNTGDLMSRMVEDIGKVRMYLGPAIMYSLNLIALFIVVIYMMVSVNPTLTIYVLLPLPILSISIYFISRQINKRSERLQKQLAALTSFVQEAYSGIKIIKSFVQERAMGKAFSDESGEYKQLSLNLARIEASFFPFMLLLIGISTILTIYIGGLSVFEGEISVGNIAEFVFYINMLTWPVASIGWVASIIQRAEASQKRINDFLFTPSKIKYPAHGPSIKGKITFDHVSFTYPETGIKALDNVSFTIEKGQKLCIIGKTGSGKSTLVQLLKRVYDVDSGNIFIDDKALQDYAANELHTKMSYAPQDVFLFSDSIKNNIGFGLDTSEMKQAYIEALAKTALVHDEIIGIKDKYSAIVGERGVTLSGGQKQRIAIARALSNKPQILILDDSLSAVDTTTERVMLNNLKEILNDKTLIMITHRILNNFDFDKIIVLEHGKIIEEGTHNELIKNKGYYYSLFELQKN